MARESTVDSGRGKSFKCATPPIITTTAATPQDSPSMTLEHGARFSDWEHNQKKSSALLKPPSVIGSIKALNLLSPDLPLNRKKADISVHHPNTTIDIEQKSIESLRTVEKMAPKCSTVTITQTPTSSVTTVTAKNGEQKTNLLKTNQLIGRRNGSLKKHRDDQLKTNMETEIRSEMGTESIGNLDGTNKGTKISKRSSNTLKNTNKISPHNKHITDTNESDAELIDNIGKLNRIVVDQHQSYHLKQHHPNFQLQRESFPCLNNRRRMSMIIDANAFHKISDLDLQKIENYRARQKAKQIETTDQSGSRKSSGTTAAMHQHFETTVNTAMSKSFKFSKKMIRKRLEYYTKGREEFSLYLFPPDSKFRQNCDWLVTRKWFDNVILLFIALNCITLAMERPNIPSNCPERYFLSTANYVFTFVFTVEMFVKVVATGMFYGEDAYFNSGWNIMDGSLVIISIVDLLMSLLSQSSPRIFGILRVFRLLRSLRPLRVINRAPGLKLVVQTLLSSLRPIGNIVLICCTFFIIFGILGVQLFKGTFYHCEGINIKHVKNKTECLAVPGNVWINRKYNFDDLGKALMSLFVLSSRDGWVNIMYTGLDAVGVDQQPIVNYNEWRLLYFIAFILLVGFFVLNMFVGVVVENFHRCREEQEKEEKIRRAAKRAVQMEKKRKRMHEPPYYTNYSPLRLFVHNVVTSKYFDLAIAAVIGLNVVTMALEYYMMPIALEYALKIFNYFFTAVFILEAIMKLVALGFKIYLKDKWNQLDVGIVMLSVVGIVLEELETKIIPINPTIIRVMRVLRIARVLKLLKMAKGIRALLDTVMQALPQVGNLGLLFFLLFFIFAALGVELFGRLECSDEHPCQGLGEHAHFANFGMAFLTLFRVATGDNWNGIMKDTLRDDCDDEADCVRNCCVSPIIAPIFFVIFVLMAQFVLVNVVVAVLMKHLEESHKQMEDELDMETELEREFQQEQEFEEAQALCMQLQEENIVPKRPIVKVLSLPPDYTFTTPTYEVKYAAQRRQTLQFLNHDRRMSELYDGISEIGSISGESGRHRRRKSSASNASNEFSRRKPWRPSFSRDASLDENPAMPNETHKYPDTKCSNSDYLYTRVDKQANIKPNDKSTSRNVFVKMNTSMDSNDSPIDIIDRKSLTKVDAISSTNTGNIFSTKKTPPVKRSGSCKQLFKQHAMDDEVDIDENSLLLPVLSRPQTQNGDYSKAKETSLYNKEDENKSQ